MFLSALSAGYAVPPANFDATVHSIFNTAVNLRPGNTDLLLTLVAASQADLPQGIRCDTPVDFSFAQIDLGKDVYCQAGTLYFKNSILAVGFERCRRWRCDLSALRTDLANPASMEAWKCAWRLVNEYQENLAAGVLAKALLQSNKNGQSSISRRVGEAIQALVESTRSDKLDDLSALTRLVGLGSGLTPSGDDILVGYLAGLWCSVRDYSERRQFIAELGQAIIHLSRRTNDISRTYLYHAAHGQVSSRLASLATALSYPESLAQVTLAAETAMRSGHSSGMDAVTGLLFGLAAWDGDSILAFR
jgi:hypothetical protein